jgi:hypothetical protein
MDLEVEIEGVSDALVLSEIKKKIRRVCKVFNRPGEWSVVVSPSETRGQWDIGVRGPFGHHFGSVTDRIERLPALVAAQLEACLYSPPRVQSGTHGGPFTRLQS